LDEVNEWLAMSEKSNVDENRGIVGEYPTDARLGKEDGKVGLH
jgi:hypothetical protein